MQLYHFTKAPNYGDALNPWLWPQLLGERLQPQSPTLFLGIGTILNAEDMPVSDRYAVLSSGGGYGRFPRPDDRWSVYAVRGPLTAQGLGIDPSLAAIDGAYLMRRCELPAPSNVIGRRIGFMPHWQTQLSVPWEKICASAGLRYISPELSVEDALAEFQACDGIIAEAMHAAITADALRIRWQPVRLGRQFLDFKWQDWLGSLQLSCETVQLPAIHPVVEWKKGEGAIRAGYRRTVNLAAHSLQMRALIARLRDLRRQFEASTQFGYLSSDDALNTGMSRLERALDRLRANET